MHHGDAGHRVSGGHLPPDPAHDFERHRLITFVIEAACGAAVGVVADGAFEGDHGALRAGEDAGDRAPGIQRLAGEGEIVAVFGDFQWFGRAAARNRRQKGDLVAFLEAARGVRKLLVARHHDAARHGPDGRKTAGIMLQNRAQVGAGGKLRVFGGHPRQIFQNAEE